MIDYKREEEREQEEYEEYLAIRRLQERRAEVSGIKELKNSSERCLMLKEVEKIHDEAMDLLDKSHVALMKKDDDLARQLKLQAYYKEKEAANRLINEDVEPSRSILFRSAASLAYDLGLFGEAEKLACLGLIGFPPEWVDVREEEEK